MKIKVGDKLPKSELFHIEKDNSIKKINLQELCENKKVIILGMPGAFTKTCSLLHLPGFIKNYQLATQKGVTQIICIAVNDPNVMKAWGESQKVGGKILMVGDPYLKFTKTIGAEIDKSDKGLGIRSTRYSMLIDNNVVKLLKEEKETAQCDLTSAEKFINLI
tara:strand:+ start:497 stop:985 length:489 start_codon:yes stop_codon:yes gene_type:complete